MAASGLESSKEVADVAGNFDRGVKTGAALAQSVENIQASRAQVEAEKQKIQMAKVDKLTSAMEIGAKMPSRSARNAYFKNYIPKMQAALGLQDFIPAETMAMIQADPEQAKKFSLLRNKIMNNEMDFATATNNMQPEEWAALDDREVEQMEAAEKFRIQQQKQDSRDPSDRLWEQKQMTEMRQLNNDVRSAFKPIEDKRVSIRTAVDSLDAINVAIKDGKKVSSIDFNVAARSLAKAFNSGAMTDEDVNDFKRLAGVEDITEANVKKYITGGAPKEAVAALMRIATRSANNLDRQAQTISKGFEDRLVLFSDKEKASKASGLATYSSPTLGGGKAPAGADPKVADYAKQYNMSYEQALQVLTKRGYKPKGK